MNPAQVPPSDGPLLSVCFYSFIAGAYVAVLSDNQNDDDDDDRDGGILQPATLLTNQPTLSRQDIDLMNKGLDALLNYMDSIAEDKFETFSEVFHRVVEAQRELKDLDMDNRRFLEDCLSIEF